jgi:multidrug efflux pump subunit AcrB
MVSHVLNLGLPSRINVQVQGQKKVENYEVAKKLAAQIAKVPGAVDVRVQQVMDYPEVFYTVDRDRASELGLQERDVADQLTISLSSSGQTAPNYWLDPRNGISYSVQVMTPQYKVSNMEDLATTPVAAGGQSVPQLFGNLASSKRQLAMAVVNHYNVMPVMDVYATNDQRDLGGVARDIDKIVDEVRPTLPRGSQIVVRGQVQSMRSSFTGIGIGILGAVVLAYILMVVNFQSWASPLVIVLGLPGALAGIIWMLYATHTTFNVPSLMGAIMAVGVATSNSILLVVFAEEQRENGRTAHQAILWRTQMHGTGLSLGNTGDPSIQLGKKSGCLASPCQIERVTTKRSQHLVIPPQSLTHTNHNGFFPHGHMHGCFHIVLGIDLADDFLRPTDQIHLPVQFNR